MLDTHQSLGHATRSMGLIARGIIMATLFSGCSELGVGTESVGESGTGIISGVVRAGDPLGENVIEGATVVFTSARDVANEDSIQPLEDLASESAYQAVTGSDGTYSLELPVGRYFPFVHPPADSDPPILAGGDASSRSIVIDPDVTMSLAITLSLSASPSATWVGASTCLGCHKEHESIKGTRHFTGIRVAGVVNPLQDLSEITSLPAGFGGGVLVDTNDDGANDFEQGLTIFAGEAGLIELGFVSSNPSQLSNGDELVVRFGGQTYALWLTYGGTGRGEGGQRFITKLDAERRPIRHSDVDTAGTYYLLPLLYDEAAPKNKRWKVVELDDWFVDTGHTTPDPALSFDVRCAGCHMTVTNLVGDHTQGLRAQLAHDVMGVFDYDGDGTSDQFNVTCERCHGPGSEHVGSGGGYAAIVNPSKLSPAARSMVCGQCHQQGVGHTTPDGLSISYPGRVVGGAFELPRAGITPAEFYATSDGRGILPDFAMVSDGGYFQPANLATNRTASWQDAAGHADARTNHARSSRQQYFDFTRSRMYRNEIELLSCFSCHDAHENKNAKQTKMPSADNTLCLSCHNGDYVPSAELKNFSREHVSMIGTESEMADEAMALIESDVLRHLAVQTFGLVGASMNHPDATYDPRALLPAGLPTGRCTTCHMPKTASSIRWTVDNSGHLLEGDVRSHVFDIISPQQSKSMAESGQTPVPNSCTPCHRGAITLGEPYPDFRFLPEGQ